MATATHGVQASASTTEQKDILTDREDYTVGFNLKPGTDDKGAATVVKEPAYYATGSEEGQAVVQKLTAEKKFEGVFTVTTSLPLAKTLAGVQQICPDVEEMCANFNRGARQKAANRLKATLLETDADGNFTFGEDKLTNGVYDQTDDIASPSRRKVLTEEEKLDRFLEQFPEAIRNSMKAAYASAKQPVAAQLHS